MARKRDFIDDLMDMQSDWRALSNPVADIASALTGDAPQDPVWNPADYKERPRANAVMCVSCQKGHTTKLCHRCMDVCPVNALEISENSIEIRDTCRKCGLCVAACPSEAFSSGKTGARKLYERIARAASAFDHAYVTCTRALGRIPEGNEVVLPCVGDVPAEVWFAVLADYSNVSVYLPLGICERCRTTTGEDAYVKAIGAAEEMSGRGVGLEVDEADLDRSKNRAYERKEFLSSIASKGITAVGAVNPAVAVARSISQKLNENTRRINALTSALDNAAGANATKRRRILTQRHQLVLTTLQKHPKLAARLSRKRPTCDSGRCTLCGECANACPTRACEVTDAGVFKVEPGYCTECGACLDVCETHALSWEPFDAAELVIPDKGEVERKKRQEEQKAEMEKLKKQGMAQLKRGLDFLEKLDTD